MQEKNTALLDAMPAALALNGKNGAVPAAKLVALAVLSAAIFASASTTSGGNASAFGSSP